MSERQWKPGDVALVNGRVCLKSGTKWEHGDERAFPYVAHDSTLNIRPLVVIDPEDREQVERLTGALVYGGAGKNDDNHWREVQAALREFANPTPPKPDEPTGWLAAVEDGDGRRWYRDGAPNESHPWRELRDDGIHARYVWREIPAVRVLSEGVTP